MGMRNGSGLLISFSVLAFSLIGCGDNGFTPPVPHEFVYSHAEGATETGWEDCHVTFETVFRSDPFYISDFLRDRERELKCEWLGLSENQAGIIRRMPEEADFQKCLIITFHNPGPALDGPYLMSDVRVRTMAFWGPDGNELLIELVGKNGEEGMFITGLIEGVELHFVTVQ